MKSLIVSTLLVALTSAATLDKDLNQGLEKPERSITCQYPFEDLHGFGCYFLSQYQMSHDAADEVCQNNGGHLVEIESQAEQIRLVEYVRYAHQMRQAYNYGDVWIGLGDRGRNGKYRWAYTRNVPTYFNWAYNEPDGLGRQHCSMMFAGKDYAWTDIGCDQWNAYALCEDNRVYFN